MASEPPLDPFALGPEQAHGAFVFFSYAHQDKRFRDRLEDHLSNLKYRGLITTWHDREIRAGEEWTQQIDIYLDKAHIILLLISADFMASDYCYSVEMKRALERHEQRKADVIPILLRPVLYTDAPFAKLQLLPTNAKPVIRWRDRDSAFFDIACGIERVAQKHSAQTLPPQPGGYPSGLNYRSQLPVRARRRRLGLFGVGVFVVGFIVAGTFALLQHPTLIPSVISLFVSILILLLLMAGIVAIGVIYERSKQRRAQEAREAARKRRYYEEAIEAYGRALLRNPSDGDAHRGMGNALYALGYYDQALNAFTQAIHFGLLPAAYAGLGDVYARLKRYSEAVAAYEKAIEIDPTVTLNYDDFMRSLRALGRKVEAEQVHARVKQLGYEDVE